MFVAQCLCLLSLVRKLSRALFVVCCCLLPCCSVVHVGVVCVLLMCEGCRLLFGRCALCVVCCFYVFVV